MKQREANQSGSIADVEHIVILMQENLPFHPPAHNLGLQFLEIFCTIGTSTLAYDLSVHGTNGFFRAYQGRSGGASVNFQSAIVYDLAQAGVILRSQNLDTESAPLRVQNLYDDEITTQLVRPGRVFQQF